MSATDVETAEDWLRARADQAASAEGCAVVEVSLKTQGARGRIEVTLDRVGGVGVEDCARVSRALAAALEGTPLLPGNWVLEVSSPGLTRPLRSAADCVRFVGRLARVETRRPVGGRTSLRGTLVPVAGGGARLGIADPPDSDPVVIEWSDVASARLDFDAPSGAPAPGRPSRGRRR